MKPYSMRTRNRGFNKTFIKEYPGMKAIPITNAPNKFSIPNIWSDFLDMVMDFFRPRKRFEPTPIAWNPPAYIPGPCRPDRSTRLELIRHGHWHGAKGKSKREQREVA